MWRMELGAMEGGSRAVGLHEVRATLYPRIVTTGEIGIERGTEIETEEKGTGRENGNVIETGMKARGFLPGSAETDHKEEGSGRRGRGERGGNGMIKEIRKRASLRCVCVCVCVFVNA